MYLQEILEVAIGIVFVWFVVSMFAMTIQEWIATTFKWRANNLEDTIRRMLDDPSFQRGFSGWWQKLWSQAARSKAVAEYESTFAKKFYDHRLIQVLSLPSKKPSYISAGKFTDVVMDMLLTAGTDASIIQSALNKVNENLDLLVSSDQRDAAKQSIAALIELAEHAAQTEKGAEVVEKLRMQVEAFSGKYPATKPLLDALLTLPPPNQPLSSTLQRLSHGILVIGAQNQHLRDSLAPLILHAEKYVGDKELALAKARQNVENWYNETMERLSGVYKRRAQIVAFLVGVLLAILVNIDSVGIIESLWREPTLRLALVARAEAEAAQAKASGQTPQQTESTNPVADLQAKLQDLSIPLGWTVLPKSDPSVSLCKWMPTSIRTDNDRFGFLLPAIESFNDVKLALTGKATLICYTPAVNANETNGFKWLLGILITGGAAAQGAPFWFDLLGKLVNVRSVGVKPEERKPKKE